MRIPKYISPSSLGKWESNREEFYKQYLCDERMPRTPQTEAMAVGSAFDAFVKSELVADLFGTGSTEYALDALMESQVDPEVRDWAYKAGEHVYDCYRYSGAYDELLNELEAADSVQFEFTAEGMVENVPLKGKPDCRYVTGDLHVILDWKVNGYCSTRATSPKKLYSMVRDGQEGKPSRNAGNPHKGYEPTDLRDLTIGKHYLEDVNPSWADQLAIYGWMSGEPVGAENMVVRIDQIVAKPRDAQEPLLRVANHKARISARYQRELVSRLVDCWMTVMSGHIFQDESREDSDARCEVLDMVVAEMILDPDWTPMEKGYRG